MSFLCYSQTDITVTVVECVATVANKSIKYYWCNIIVVLAIAESDCLS